MNNEIPDIETAPFNQLEKSSQKGIRGFLKKSVKAQRSITLRVTEKQYQAIKQECSERGVTVSQMLRAGISRYLSPPSEDGSVGPNQL
jgi:predicted DNA binding CopG/RHH family protein